MDAVKTTRTIQKITNVEHSGAVKRHGETKNTVQLKIDGDSPGNDPVLLKLPVKQLVLMVYAHVLNRHRLCRYLQGKEMTCEEDFLEGSRNRKSFIYSIQPDLTTAEMVSLGKDNTGITRGSVLNVLKTALLNYDKYPRMIKKYMVDPFQNVSKINKYMIELIKLHQEEEEGKKEEKSLERKTRERMADSYAKGFVCKADLPFCSCYPPWDADYEDFEDIVEDPRVDFLDKAEFSEMDTLP